TRGTTHGGKKGVVWGPCPNRLWNNSDDGQRVYDALQFQSGYRINARWNAQANYTLQLKNEGNQEGEAPNQPGTPSPFSGFYPELFDQARNFPIGPLVGFERHRIRAWTSYDFGLGRIGTLDVGLLYRFDSGSAYSIRSTGQPLTAVQKAIGESLYPDLPGSQTIYYSQGRGSERFANASLFDVALTYNVPVVSRVKFWVKGECRNLFDSTPLISTNISTRPDPNSPVAPPVLYIRGGWWGRARPLAPSPPPRDFSIAAGFRFWVPGGARGGGPPPPRRQTHANPAGTQRFLTSIIRS